MSDFVHLHTHSHFSLLSALPKIPDLVAKAKADGQKALALTDLGNLYGAIEFYKECLAAEIKPIIGLEAYTAARTRADRQSGIDNRRGRLILLAENVTGYKNLLKLVTKSHLEGFYYRPRVDRELIERYCEGLIAITPTYGGEIATAVKNRNEEKAAEIASWYKSIFGEKNFFIELTRHPEVKGYDDENLRAFSEKHNIGTVAGADVYYLVEDDRRARDTLLSVQAGVDYGDFANPDNGFDLSFPTQKEMLSRFKSNPEAVKNALKIAQRCNLELKLGSWVFPDYKTKSGQSYDDELREKVIAGLKRRALTQTQEIKDRIEYELKIIKDKGYAPYFLVVGDLMDYAHAHNILTTIRGSVAGSLVTYLAGITNVNPIEYKLPFERFLNPERPSAPDIDMDFADNRRDEMIDYVKQKYGADKVAQIGTFGTMMARGAVRDVSRALGFEYGVGDRIAKLIPLGAQGFPMTIDRAMDMVPELKKLYKEDTAVHDIITIAKKIEGCARHISVHAAGVVIAPMPLDEYVPLQFDPKGENLPDGRLGKIITQYDMHAVEDAGLLKFDFLGIKNLAILADAVSLVKLLEGRDIDIENVPLDDKKTFSMLAQGETGGLFQLNGTGMTRYLKDLRPTSIHDINAMVALYRPGPMESIPKYIERKQNPRLITYLDPRLQSILSASYGVITYQDDVMLIAINLAGYSWLEADKLRKAMGKKIPAEMAAQREKLIAGFVKNGLSAAKAEELWKLIEPFAAYGFNKAHAASYGKVAYQTAYMKANFPAIYMSAVLTADSGDVEKIGEIIAECRRMGISVLPPNVNESFEGFTVVKSPGESDKIRFGLTTIKNFGEGIAKSIIANRKSHGKFKTLADFLERVQDRNLNKKSLEALIKAGAMDELGERGQMLLNLEELLTYHKDHARSGDQTSLFGGSVSDLRLKPSSPVKPEEALAWEKELLGLYISGHPLEKFRDVLEKREINVRRVKEEYREGMQIVLGGIIEEAKNILTKKNEQMVFARLADLSGSIEVVGFPKVYAAAKDLLAADKCVAVKGRVSKRNGETSLIAEAVRALDAPMQKT